MRTIHARFDGQVIIPDEPLDLPPNQALVVQIEPITHTSDPVEESALTWLAAHALKSPTLPADLADQHDQYLYSPLIKGQ